MSKTVKAALKEAREYIDKKDFKSGLKCCKRALNVEKDNYLGLVFSGLCHSELQQLEQAEESYKKAIEKDEEQLVAWQGIVAFYEKHGKNDPDFYQPKLATSYRSLANLQLTKNKDSQKYFNLTEKSWKIRETRNELDLAIEILQEQVKNCIDHEDIYKVAEAKSQIIRILNQNSESLNESQISTLMSTLKSSITNDQSIQNQENMKILIKLLYKTRDMESLLKVALKMMKVYPGSSHPLEWFCKVYLEWATDTIDIKDEESLGVLNNPSEIVDRLLGSNSTSTLANLCKGAMLWKNQDYSEAVNILDPLLSNNTNPNFYGYFILCDSSYKSGDFSSAEKQIEWAKLFSHKVKEASTRNKMEKYLNDIFIQSLNAQYSNTKLAKALEILEQSEDKSDPQVKILIIKMVLATKSRNLTESETAFLDKIMDSEDENIMIIRALMTSNGESEEILTETLKKYPNSFEAHLLLGKHQFQQKQLSKSTTNFLKAAKLNPCSAEPFLFLGHLYKSSPGVDLEKSRKCYQKSFSLDPQSGEAGCNLSDIYRQLGFVEKNLQFLTSVTANAIPGDPKSKWAFLRMGILHLESGNPADAIVSLQNASRCDPNDFLVWDCLAEAYCDRGSFNSALKTFERVLALNPKAYSAHLKQGTIKHLLGQYLNAIDTFRLALISVETTENKVPILKGLAESLLSQSREYLDEFLDLNAVDCLSEALEILCEAAQLRSDLLCLWKMMGEVCTLVSPISEKSLVNFRIPSFFAQSSEVEDNSSGMKEKILKLGTICYLQGIKLLASQRVDDENAIAATFWHDLALNFYYRSTCHSNMNKEILEKAKLAIKKALNLKNGQDAKLWNVLGVLSLSQDNFALSQHSFIRSITLGPTPEAWTNLGTLYFILGEVKHANQAFKESQNLEPGYLKGWVGQALIAEQAGVEEESMDLFRHATFLGYEVESSVAYSELVCKTLRQMGRGKRVLPHNLYCIEKMFAITISSDCLYRASLRCLDEDPCTLNLQGLVFERKGMLNPSRVVLERALSKASEETSRDHVLFNLCRVYQKLNEHEKAVKCISAIKNKDIDVFFSLALAYFKAGQYQLSYQIYQQALNNATDEATKSHILCAMATLAYKVQGAEAAKTLLFQACQLSPPSMQGIFALCVLGIKQEDKVLTQAAFKEMKPFENDEKWMAEILALKAKVLAMNGQNLKLAQREISKQIHCYPHVRNLWPVLLDYLVKTDNRSIERCAEKCSQMMVFGWKSGTLNWSDVATLSLLTFDDDNTVSKKIVRRAAKSSHLYPDQNQSWLLLWLALSKTSGYLTDFAKTMTRIETKFRQ